MVVVVKMKEGPSSVLVKSPSAEDMNPDPDMDLEAVRSRPSGMGKVGRKDSGEWGDARLPVTPSAPSSESDDPGRSWLSPVLDPKERSGFGVVGPVNSADDLPVSEAISVDPGGTAVDPATGATKARRSSTPGATVASDTLAKSRKPLVDRLSDLRASVAKALV